MSKQRFKKGLFFEKSQFLFFYGNPVHRTVQSKAKTSLSSFTHRLSLKTKHCSWNRSWHVVRSCMILHYKGSGCRSLSRTKYLRFIFLLRDSLNKYEEHLEGSRSTLNILISRPFLEVKSDLDFSKTLLKTSGVTRPSYWLILYSYCSTTSPADKISGRLWRRIAKNRRRQITHKRFVLRKVTLHIW